MPTNRDASNTAAIASSHTRSLDHSLFLGRWLNTDSENAGIHEVSFNNSDGRLTLQVLANTDNGLIDLGVIDVTVMSDSPDSKEGTKFAVACDLGFMQVRMHGWVKLGVLVFSVFNHYADNSGRSNFFTREFFRQVERIRDG